MLVPAWWIALTVVCFVLSTVAVVGLLVGLVVATSRANALLTQISADAVPKALAIAEHVNGVTDKLDKLVARLDAETLVALPKVENVLERVDHTLELVETNSERMNGVIEGTSERIEKVRHSPYTKAVLIGAGGLAAVRTVRNVIVGHRNGKHNGNGNGKHV